MNIFLRVQAMKSGNTALLNFDAVAPNSNLN
jgi:hypothetical protein